MAQLVLGPMLRYADRTRATVWVETDMPCEVSVLDATERTFTVHGHHYAIVVVDGLAPGSTIPYTVRLDGEQVWPVAGSTHPPSRIRTQDESNRLRFVFGSCRTSVPHKPEEWKRHGVDVLRAYARRMATAADDADWPDALLFLGDQVYADETSPQMKDIIARRRDVTEPPFTEVADFEEYAQLYRLAWSDEHVRWLLSTVPSAMIFDDHDIRDDWNASRVWREQMRSTSWWQRRVVGGLAAYWLYQHLGNLGPAELGTDDVLAQLRRCAASGQDGGASLDRFAAATDTDPAGTRWSYVRDFGRVRLVMVDSRCGRVLDEGQRAMLDREEQTWVEEQADADVDHLLIGTSLPVLLPRGIHHVEGWDEALTEGVWGPRAARMGERLRQAVDLEHWAAFRQSFTAMAGLVRRAASRAPGPASVIVLSGDVHYSYLARATFQAMPAGAGTVVQAVCSPIRNPLARWMRYANGFAQFAVARAVGRALARASRVREPDIDWSIESGPIFDNALATLLVEGRAARVRWEKAALADGTEVMRAAAEVVVTDG